MKTWKGQQPEQMEVTMYLHLKPHSKLKENTDQKTEAHSTKQDSHTPLSIFLEEKAVSFLLMVACLDETHTPGSSFPSSDPKEGCGHTDIVLHRFCILTVFTHAHTHTSSSSSKTIVKISKM